MRTRRRLLASGLLVALLLWGHFYEAPDERRPFMVGAELAWVRAFDTWLVGVGEAVENATSTTDTSSEDALDELQSCAGVEDRVASAPTARLASIEERLPEACALLRRFASTRRTDASAADRHLRRAVELLDDADEAVYNLLGYTSALPAVTGGSADEASIVRRLSRVASDWVGVPVEARCFPAGDWERARAERAAWNGEELDDSVAAFAETEQHRIVLGPLVCAPLEAFESGDRVPGDASESALRLADALVLLAHETAHVDDPDADEASALCVAMQRAVWTGMRLGMRREDARRLARLYWSRLYPDQDDEYRSDECRDGGALDEHPLTKRWP